LPAQPIKELWQHLQHESRVDCNGYGGGFFEDDDPDDRFQLARELVLYHLTSEHRQQLLEEVCEKRKEIRDKLFRDYTSWGRQVAELKTKCNKQMQEASSASLAHAQDIASFESEMKKHAVWRERAMQRIETATVLKAGLQTELEGIHEECARIRGDQERARKVYDEVKRTMSDTLHRTDTLRKRVAEETARERAFKSRISATLGSIEHERERSVDIEKKKDELVLRRSRLNEDLWDMLQELQKHERAVHYFRRSGQRAIVEDTLDVLCT
jgi:chromosome segregation ATPase